jgi:hypothetical protein
VFTRRIAMHACGRSWFYEIDGLSALDGLDEREPVQ